MNSRLKIEALILAGLLGVIFSAGAQDPIDILFAGNSFTHGHINPALTYNSGAITDANGTGYGGVAGIFKQFTVQESLNYNVTIEAVSSMTLEWQYENKASIIGDPKWDTVILQELSTGPLPIAHGGDPSTYYTGAQNLKNLILANNPAASIYLYETWASPTSVTNQYYTNAGGLQGMQDDLQAATYKAYYDIGFTGVARVGDAFMRAVDQGVADSNPADGISTGKINLWASDDSRHASEYGSYLSAAVIYAKVTGGDPRSLDVGAGSAAFALGLDATAATSLNRIAYEITALADPSVPAQPAKFPVTSAGFSGSVSAGSPPRITGNGTLVSLTTTEGTFTNLTGATASSVVTSNTFSSVGTAPANANVAVTGLTVNDGVNNLQSGNFQFGLGVNGINSNTRFFILESAPVSSAVGDAATISLIDASNTVVGTFSLSLSVSDYTASAANDTSNALATINYATGQGNLTAKLGAASFSLADFTGTGDLSQVTGLRITSTTLDPNVVGLFTVPEPGTWGLAAMGLGLIIFLRNRKI